MSKALSTLPVPTTTITVQANLSSREAPTANSDINVSGTLVNSQSVAPSTRVSVLANLFSGQSVISPVLGYDPLNSLHNMSSGFITPSYSTDLTVYDNAGNAREVKIGFVKTAANSWAAEIYAPNRHFGQQSPESHQLWQHHL